jgi:ABC-2 type transport system permease protein
MTAATLPQDLRPRPAGFLYDVGSIAGRALRAVPRDLEAVVPPVFIAVLLRRDHRHLGRLTEAITGFDYTSFQMAAAILLGVTGVSRAPALVLDVQNQYFDRLLLTPVKRSAILLGHMVADVAVAAALTVPIVVLGFILGVRFDGGPIGVVVFVALASLWSLAFAGFGYAIALETRQSGSGQLGLPVVLPVPVLTSSYVPRSQLSGWLDTVARFNPVTYLLDGPRSVVMVGGWQRGELAQALLAIALVGLVSMTMCFVALRGRIRRG